jgi:hypothetical protein
LDKVAVFTAADYTVTFGEELMRSAQFHPLATFGAVFLILSLAVPRISPAQEMSEQDKKMMEMMMKYGTPGEHHELLKKYVGDWDVDIRAWPKPGAEPVISKGTMRNELLFDGRFLMSRFEGMMGGQKAMGLEIISYDLFQDKYVTFWIDSWNTMFVTTSGTLDFYGNLLTETGAYPDTMTDGKKMVEIRNVTTFVGNDKYMFEVYMLRPGGKETKGMEFIVTRKK